MSLTATIIQFLREFLMSEELLEYRVDAKSFTRRRKLPLWRVVVLILGMVHSYGNRLQRT